MLNENAETPRNTPQDPPPELPQFHVTLQGARENSLALYDASVRSVEVYKLIEQELEISSALRLKVTIARLYAEQVIRRAKGAL